jgi:hypothetical protein
MATSKQRTTLYLSKTDKNILKKRASEINKTMSEYVAELLMWDNRFRLIEHARQDSLDIKNENTEYATAER